MSSYSYYFQETRTIKIYPPTHVLALYWNTNSKCVYSDMRLLIGLLIYLKTYGNMTREELLSFFVCLISQAMIGIKTTIFKSLSYMHCIIVYFDDIRWKNGLVHFTPSFFLIAWFNLVRRRGNTVMACISDFRFHGCIFSSLKWYAIETVMMWYALYKCYWKVNWDMIYSNPVFDVYWLNEMSYTLSVNILVIQLYIYIYIERWCYFYAATP